MVTQHRSIADQPRSIADRIEATVIIWFGFWIVVLIGFGLGYALGDDEHDDEPERDGDR